MGVFNKILKVGEGKRVPDRTRARHIDRKGIDVVVCHHDVILGILGFEERSVLGHGDRGGGRADSQGQIHAYGRIDRNSDPIADQLLEAWRLNCQ